MESGDWEARLASVWASLESLPEELFLSAIVELAAVAPPGTGIGDFERACALDSTGHPDLAAPLYLEALERGLTGERRRRAVIQRASSLRNIGSGDESVALLRAELERNEPDTLEDAVRGFLALALADTGSEREAAALAIGALARHLPRYQRSLASYSEELLLDDA